MTATVAMTTTKTVAVTATAPMMMTVATQKMAAIKVLMTMTAAMATTKQMWLMMMSVRPKKGLLARPCCYRQPAGTATEGPARALLVCNQTPQVPLNADMRVMHM